MTDVLIERLRNPIGFAVLHTEAMQAIERIQKAEAEIERLQEELQMAVKWRDNYKLAFERCQGKIGHSE